VNRRDALRLATFALKSLIGLVLAVPAAAYILTPLRKRNRDSSFDTLARLSQLEVGVPRSFAIIEERHDAWVRFPREPVGSVWLVRQQAGVKPVVVAFSAECPHLGCAVNLAAGGQAFVCPCHTSAFDLKGKPENKVPPRPLDRLEVEITEAADPEVRVKFQRFRSQIEEKVPLV
jgi:menaquinol-cytochrome c reductase iron-sulfur subunit